jgi:hypothetical protein
VEAAAFRVVAGEDLVGGWTSSPGTERRFARCCGSPLYKTVESSPEVIRLRLGTLDSDPETTVERHIFLTSKVPWLTIADDLPEHPGGAPFGERE